VTRHRNGQFAQSRQALGVVTLVAVGAVIAACGATSANGTVSTPTFASGLHATPSGTPGPTSGNLGETLSMVDTGGDSGRFMTALVERWTARIGAAVRRIARRAVRTEQEGTASHASRPL
jgi:ABC-type glycerol-3-phosphate transport system substrate-binding protein